MLKHIIGAMVQRIHTISNGEMVKHSGEMVIFFNKKHLHLDMVKFWYKFGAMLHRIPTTLHN